MSCCSLGPRCCNACGPSPRPGLSTQAPPPARYLGLGHTDSEPEPNSGSGGGQPGGPTGHARPRSGHREADGPRPGHNDRAAAMYEHDDGHVRCSGSLIRVIAQCRPRRSGAPSQSPAYRHGCARCGRSGRLRGPDRTVGVAGTGRGAGAFDCARLVVALLDLTGAAVLPVAWAGDQA
jgi:hypothetical protein